MALAGAHPQVSPPRSTTPSETLVASGEMAGGPSAGPLRYEVRRDSTGAVWVDLSPTPETTFRVHASTVDALGETLAEHFPDEARRLRVTSIGVDGSSVSIGFQQTLGLVLLAVVGAALMGLGAVALLIVRGRRAHRRAVVLDQISRHQVESRERERARIARELHDGAVQDLSALAMTLEPGPETNAAREGMRTVARDLRALAEGLRPPVLDRFGLAVALSDLADRAAGAPTPLEVDLHITGEAPLSVEAELVLFRVAQEALTNAAAHGRARRATVGLVLDGPVVSLNVRDDGVGFPNAVSFDELVRAGHFGLAGMRERARAIGAELSLASPLGGGASVSIHAPADCVRPAP